MNINIDTSNIDLVHNPDILALVLKSLVLGEQTQLTVQEFYDKFEMELVLVVIDTAN